MSAHEITRRLEIDYGHRLLRHRGKCANYHGHRGVVMVSARVKAKPPAPVQPSLPITGHNLPSDVAEYAVVPLPLDGMVIDFSIVKDVLGGWLDTYWDHGMLLQRGDPMIEMLIRETMSRTSSPEEAAQLARDAAPQAILGGSPKFFVLDKPPTAEHLAEHLFEMCKVLFADYPIEVTRVVFYETPNCCAEYPAPPLRVPLLHETVGTNE